MNNSSEIHREERVFLYLRSNDSDGVATVRAAHFDHHRERSVVEWY